jgi:hypothetical protein
VQEWGYEQEINELKSVAAARQQIEAAQEYVTRYLDGLAIGLYSLDIDLDTHLQTTSLSHLLRSLRHGALWKSFRAMKENRQAGRF